MKTFRVYVNRKITTKGGGDFVRHEDVEVGDQETDEEARAKVTVKSTEQIGDVVQICPDLTQP